MSFKKKTTFVVAHGSGGHIIPALAYAEQERPHDTIFVLTGKKPLEKQLTAGYQKLEYPAVSFPGKKFWLYPLFLSNVLFSFFKTISLFLTTKGDKEIVTTGGILSIPLCLAAWTLRIPITLIELNAVFGKATRFLSPFATEVLTVFDEKNHVGEKYRIISYPLRLSIRLEQTTSKENHPLTIALFGGSQGSTSLNQFFITWLEQNKELHNDIFVYHFFGNDTTFNYKKWYQDHEIKAIVEPWTDHPEEIYQKADLVFSRAGSGAIHELLHYNKKTVLVPLRSVADDHQYHNALAIAKKHPELFFVVTDSTSQDSLSTFIKKTLG